MPLFRRPFPSRRWLKDSLAATRAKVYSTQRTLDALQGRYLREVGALARENDLLRAQVKTQANTIAVQDADYNEVWAMLGTANAETNKARDELAEQAAHFHAILKGEKLHPIVERLISTLWASRRRWQEEPRGERLGFAFRITFPDDGYELSVVGDQAVWITPEADS